MNNSRKLTLERLEDRLAPTAWGIANLHHLALSFVPHAHVVHGRYTNVALNSARSATTAPGSGSMSPAMEESGIGATLTGTLGTVVGSLPIGNPFGSPNG